MGSALLFGASRGWPWVAFLLWKDFEGNWLLSIHCQAQYYLIKVIKLPLTFSALGFSPPREILNISNMLSKWLDGLCSIVSLTYVLISIWYWERKCTVCKSVQEPRYSMFSYSYETCESWHCAISASALNGTNLRVCPHSIFKWRQCKGQSQHVEGWLWLSLSVKPLTNL